MKKIILTLAFVLVQSLGFGQALQWHKNYGGTSDETATCIQNTSDGGYIVSGVTTSNDVDVSGNHGNQDFWVMKISNTGTVVWQKTLGGTGNESAQSIQTTSDGGYIVVGFTNSTNGDISGNHGGYDAWVVKLNATGSIVWQKALGGTGTDGAYSVQSTSDGGSIVVGYTTSNNGDVSGNHGNDDVWVVKLSATGTVSWQKTFGGTDNDQGYSVQTTTDGGYIVSGFTTSTNGDVTGNHGGGDAWVVKLTSTGTLVWQKALGGSGSESFKSIQAASDGGYIMAGTASSFDGDVTGNHGFSDAWVVKLSDTGALVWQKALGGTYSDAANSIQETADGSFIVSGFAESGYTVGDGDVTGHSVNCDINNLNGSWRDVWILKLSATGTLVWQKPYGNCYYDEAFSVQTTSDGGCIVAGATKSAGAAFPGDLNLMTSKGATDVWILKVANVAQPAAPTANAQSLCSGATVASLVATGTDLKWYATATTLTALTTTAVLATGTYYVTQTVSGIESTRKSVSVTITPSTTPTFNQVASICSGGSLSALPTFSTNGYFGTWSPALNNLATTSYTFTPTSGQCINTATMTITVNVTPTPTAPAQALCGGERVSNLTATGTAIRWYNAASGGFELSSNDFIFTAGTYYITQTLNTCQSARTPVSISINFPVTPTFNQVPDVCAGATISALPTTSLENIPGTWSPDLDTTTTTDYYFQPDNGQCAMGAVMTITVLPSVSPTFTQVAPIFPGGNLTALPTTSNNGVAGTWSPALNNAATTTYTFTPTTGLCASTATMTITVNANPTPIFTQVAPICAGANLAALPTLSNNSISGTWSPAINNLATTTYTFTPTAGQNATSTTMTIVVNASTTPTFNAIAPICSGASLSAIPTTSTNSISGTWSPALSSIQTTDYTFTPNGGGCTTTAMLTITVYPITAAPTAQAQTFCNSGTVAQLTATGTQLKWYAVASNGSSLAANTAVSAGTYYVTQTLNGCESERTSVAVSINTTPPIVSNTFYVTSNTHIGDLFGYDSIYKVYTTANVPAALPQTNMLTDGNYFATQTINGCESTRTQVTIVTYGAPSISSPTCGSTLSDISAPITGTAVTNATGYAFEVTGNGTTRTFHTNTNSFNLTQLIGGIAYGTTYTVRVAAGFGYQYGNFGAACTLTTPATANATQVISSMCGTTLASMTTPIYCGQVVGATAYRFEFTTGGVAKTIDSVTNNVQISNLTGGATYSTAYSVRVAAKVAGVWQDFGYPCTVTTPAPSTQIRTNQCGTTLATKWTILNCGAITGATLYRFEWSNGGTVLTYTSSTSSMQLGNYTGWAINTTYSVRVAVQFGGTWQAYGTACNVKSPAVARFISEEAAALTIKAIPNPFETEYVLMAQGGNQTPVEVSVYDMLGKQVEQFSVEANELENRSLGTNYSSGIYNVMISQGDAQQVVRIIKK
ncbi:MAG: hypothetical protein CFE24_12265 [Flavobacterium sp. BFFFF2]|nr:MAG: hypothetical protein CFE24_12265 [Flavobacterium sp. BFFFF2]